MDKNAIKKFAVWARRELIFRVTQRALQFGIDRGNCLPANADHVGDKPLTRTQMDQRKALLEKIQNEGYEQVMEEAAYTWFNRFIALRFMEVNGYLPSHVRVFSDDENRFKPQILSEAMNLDWPELDRQKILSDMENNRDDELFKYLVIAQCNVLNEIMPRMFQKISDYTELLFPDNLLREGSVLHQMVTAIPENDWTDQVQIIGWLYQYYNSEKKDEVFANLKKNVKISKENIPAATQLFTPDWIVRYMVENSLGRIYVSGRLAGGQGTASSEQQRLEKETAIAAEMGWRYYLPEAEQKPEVRAQLSERPAAELTSLRAIDPCCGSGHILAYLFDVFMQMYESGGYSAREAVESILRNNLFGLDIDERAAQLAYFAVMMKARKYDRRFFTRVVQPQVYTVAESNHVRSYGLDAFVDNDPARKRAMDTLLSQLRDAKEYGSILTVTEQNWDALNARFDELHDEGSLGGAMAWQDLLPLVQVGQLLSRKYDIVVTNPPYMGSSGMSAKLSDYVKKNYPDSKSDLFAVFMERGNQMAKMAGINCMVTMQSWMFLSSFEKMRTNMLNSGTILTLMHMENMVMHIAFGTAVTVFQKGMIAHYKGTYNQIKLQDITNEDNTEKPKAFPVPGNRFAQTDASNFSKIPGSPVAYWVNASILTAYEQGNLIGDYADVKIGMGTGKNEIFVREWWEVFYTKIDFSLKTINDLAESKGRYFPYNKGGEFRLWFGNLQEVLWFDTEGRRYMDTMSGHRENGARDFYCKEGLTWSFISSSKFGIRYLPTGCFFDVAGSTLFSRDDNAYTLGFLASCVCFDILGILNPTLNYQAGNIKSLPLLIDREDEVDERVYQNIQISKEDWDSYENSWDFTRNTLV